MVQRTIRVRRTVDDEGQLSAVLLVYCPRRSRTLLLDDCAECEQCEEVKIDPAEADSYVRCSRIDPPADGEVTVQSAPVVDVLAHEVLCVDPAARIEAFAQLLLERGLSGAPVVDAEGRVLGFVSKTDLVRAHRRAAAHTVAEIMTPLAVTISEGASIAEASALMALEGVHRLPVVNNAMAGKVVGIVSALDVLAWIARQCGYLRPEQGPARRPPA